MKKTKFVLIALIASIVTISCSSDDDSSGGQEETLKLVKTEKASDNLKIDYQYNDNGLLTKATAIYPNFGYESVFTYDSDKNLTKWEFEETGNFPATSTYTFLYDSEGRLSQYDNAAEITTFSYSGNIVTIEDNTQTTAELELNGNGLITKFTEATQYTVFGYDSNGNMISAESFDNNDEPLTSFTITYDNKVNPFYGQFKSIYLERFIEFFWEFDGIYISGFEGYSFPYSRNNITSIKENNVEIASYTYSYDSEDFPLNVDEDYDGDIFNYELEYTR
mgnify:CR=1 FL=1